MSTQRERKDEHRTSDRERRPDETSEEEIDERIEESFPASDAPSFTPEKTGR